MENKNVVATQPQTNAVEINRENLFSHYAIEKVVDIDSANLVLAQTENLQGATDYVKAKVLEKIKNEELFKKLTKFSNKLKRFTYVEKFSEYVSEYCPLEKAQVNNLLIVARYVDNDYKCILGAQLSPTHISKMHYALKDIEEEKRADIIKHLIEIGQIDVKKTVNDCVKAIKDYSAYVEKGVLSYEMSAEEVKKAINDYALRQIAEIRENGGLTNEEKANAESKTESKAESKTESKAESKTESKADNVDEITLTLHESVARVLLDYLKDERENKAIMYVATAIAKTLKK